MRFTKQVTFTAFGLNQIRRFFLATLTLPAWGYVIYLIILAGLHFRNGIFDLWRSFFAHFCRLAHLSIVKGSRRIVIRILSAVVDTAPSLLVIRNW